MEEKLARNRFREIRRGNLDLIEKALDQYARDIPEGPNLEITEIPCGRNVTVHGSTYGLTNLDRVVAFNLRPFNESKDRLDWFKDSVSGSLDQFPEATRKSYLEHFNQIPSIIDLDTGRTPQPPEKLLGNSSGGNDSQPKSLPGS